ncbi:MAG: hypothetical protein B6U94_08110 [Thermofilum sp. ex4484_79]|nr:MAG: hypothetical protein B6U94_08110 [Thermofilum sp. ex4484_79]
MIRYVNPREADYLLAIFDIKSKGEKPRNMEIMKKLNVSKSTASLMLKKLERKDLVLKKKGYLELTKKGLTVIYELLWRHGVTELSLSKLGLEPEEACLVSRRIEMIIPFDVLIRIWEQMNKPLKCPLGIEFPDINNINLSKTYYICGSEKQCLYGVQAYKVKRFFLKDML